MRESMNLVEPPTSYRVAGAVRRGVAVSDQGAESRDQWPAPDAPPASTRSGRGARRLESGTAARVTPGRGVDLVAAHDHHGHMRTMASIADVKARLSEYVRRVKAGHEVVVTDRGVPVARLTGLEMA